MTRTTPAAPKTTELLGSIATFVGLSAFVCIVVLGLASYSARMLAGLLRVIEL